MKFLALAALGGLAFLGLNSAAQTLPELKTPAKGETINMSIQNGTRSQLSFGSSSNFGSSVNLTATEGTSAAAVSNLAPANGATLTFSIGTGAKPGETSANIDNLRAQGSGATAIGGAPIDATNSTFSSGNAILTGVQSQLSITLDSNRTGFKAQTNTLHSAYGLDGQNGAQLKSSSQSANASGNALVNSNTNVDINSSNFTNIFMQAF